MSSENNFLFFNDRCDNTDEKLGPTAELLHNNGGIGLSWTGDVGNRRDDNLGQAGGCVLPRCKESIKAVRVPKSENHLARFHQDSLDQYGVLRISTTSLNGVIVDIVMSRRSGHIPDV